MNKNLNSKVRVDNNLAINKVIPPSQINIGDKDLSNFTKFYPFDQEWEGFAKFEKSDGTTGYMDIKGREWDEIKEENRKIYLKNGGIWFNIDLMNGVGIGITKEDRELG